MHPKTVAEIGTAGQKWGNKEKLQWRALQTIKRSYLDEVVSKIQGLSGQFEVIQYGALSYSPEKYPLFAIKSKNWEASKPTVLITGGVHGYETSGVHGAIGFVEKAASRYQDKFNILVTPCISPWGYETINRWNPNADDPNRSFYDNSPAEESAAVMAFVASLGTKITSHIDLHETTDTDNTEFRPALAARDAVEHKNWNIPDGFYSVGDTLKPVPDFQKAIIESVEKVTHIAPADENGEYIGEPLEQHGVINYATKALGLCAGFSNSDYCTTTEVYPDSPNATPAICVDAQIAAITGGLDYLIKELNL